MQIDLKIKIIESIAGYLGVDLESVLIEDEAGVLRIQVASEQVSIRHSLESGYVEQLSGVSFDICDDIWIAKKASVLWHWRPLYSVHGNSTAGVYVWPEDKACLFLGGHSVEDNMIDVSLYPFPSIYFFLGGPLSVHEGQRSLSSYFNHFCAFVAYETDPPLERLARSGYQLRSRTVFQYPFVEINSSVRHERKSDVPGIVFDAWRHSLSPSLGPDEAFLKAYRVLETVFAYAMRKQLLGGNEYNFYRFSRGVFSMTELDALESVFSLSSQKFTESSVAHFLAMYPSAVSTSLDGKYKKLGKWAMNSNSWSVPNDIRAALVYYVRCSLVHAKTKDDELFLLGPFSSDCQDALMALYCDIVNFSTSVVFDSY